LAEKSPANQPAPCSGAQDAVGSENEPGNTTDRSAHSIAALWSQGSSTRVNRLTELFLGFNPAVAFMHPLTARRTVQQGRGPGLSGPFHYANFVHAVQVISPSIAVARHIAHHAATSKEWRRAEFFVPRIQIGIIVFGFTTDQLTSILNFMKCRLRSLRMCSLSGNLINNNTPHPYVIFMSVHSKDG